MAKELRISRTAIENYDERILGGTGMCPPAVSAAIEAEINGLLARCQFTQFHRYVVRVDGVRFVIVDGVVVTTLGRGVMPWVGIHKPGFKVEIGFHNAR